MEDASKALLMAAGVLIAVLILAIFVRMVTNISKPAEAYAQTTDIIELRKYNSKFEVYIGRTDITAQEILSLINYAKEQNKGTKIYIGSTEYNESTSLDESDFFADKLERKYQYSASSYDKGKVISIKFTEI